MITQTVNHLLLDSLINIDFLLLKKHYFVKNLSVLNLIKLHKNLFLHILNPLNLIIKLKQFFRILQFFKKTSPMFNFFVQGEHQKLIIDNFIKKNQLNLKFQIFFKFLVLKKNFSMPFLILLKNYAGNKSLFSKTLQANHFFLIQEINPIQAKKSIGSYKILNDLTDYKKLIFILIFVRQI
jgi:hypothetical protein